jgi:hypothetical protein
MVLRLQMKRSGSHPHSSQVWGPTLPYTGSESLLDERTTRPLYKNGEEALPMIRLQTHIQAPVERCFDLSLTFSTGWPVFETEEGGLVS